MARIEVPVFTAERRIYVRGRLVSTALEASYGPIRAEDFPGFRGERHVVTAAGRPSRRIRAPEGSRPGLSPPGYAIEVPLPGGGWIDLTAGRLLRYAELGLLGLVLERATPTFLPASAPLYAGTLL